MKTLQNKTILLILGLCSLGLIYSFSRKKKVKTKKYEVIRTVNGKVTIFDTIIKASSGFTPDNYLTLLGFQDDQNIKIIDFDGESAVYNFTDEQEGSDGTTSNTKVKIVKLKNEDGEDIGINQDVRIIKQSESSSEDFKDLNIDSLVNSITSTYRGDSVIIKKVIVSEDMVIDDNSKQHKIVKIMKFSDTEGQDINIDTDQSDHLMPNLTVVIVSNGEESTEEVKKNLLIDGNNLDIGIFPNPATDQVKINFESDKKVETTIRIIDLEGKVVYENHLGEVIGSHSELVNTEKFASGTYIINLQSGDQRSNQKLVIE